MRILKFRGEKIMIEPKRCINCKSTKIHCKKISEIPKRFYCSCVVCEYRWTTGEAK